MIEVAGELDAIATAATGGGAHPDDEPVWVDVPGWAFAHALSTVRDPRLFTAGAAALGEAVLSAAERYDPPVTVHTGEEVDAGVPDPSDLRSRVERLEADRLALSPEDYGGRVAWSAAAMRVGIAVLIGTLVAGPIASLVSPTVPVLGAESIKAAGGSLGGALANEVLRPIERRVVPRLVAWDEQRRADECAPAVAEPAPLGTGLQGHAGEPRRRSGLPPIADPRRDGPARRPPRRGYGRR